MADFADLAVISPILAFSSWKDEVLCATLKNTTDRLITTFTIFDQA